MAKYKHMKEIVFTYSGATYTGTITKQEPHELMGLKTCIDTPKQWPQEWTIYGKCEVGYCGPFHVISIKALNTVVPSQ